MDILLSAGSAMNSAIQLIGVLLIFVFVLIITYFTTKWMAGYQKTHTSEKNLKLIETIHVGNNKMISIVEAGDVFLVISIGKDEIHLLTQLTREQLKDYSFEDDKEVRMPQESFQELLGKMKDKFPKKQD